MSHSMPRVWAGVDGIFAPCWKWSSGVWARSIILDTDAIFVPGDRPEPEYPPGCLSALPRCDAVDWGETPADAPTA